MKIRLILLFLFGLTLFVSCSKEKGTDELSVESNLLGKWQLKTFTYFDGINQQTVSFELGEYLEFERGGKLTARVDDEISYSTWELLDEGKTLFILDNGTLDVPASGYEIKTLTNNSLVLYVNEAGDETTMTLQK